MNEYKLCAALGQLPEDMIAAAMDAGADAVRRRRFAALTVLRRVTSGVVAAAIVLAIFFGLPVPGGDQIVATPGVLVVTAYGDGLDPEGVVLEEGVVLPQWAMHPSMSGMPSSFSLKFQMPAEYGENVEFCIYTQQSGWIYVWERMDEKDRLLWGSEPGDRIQTDDFFLGTMKNENWLQWQPYDIEELSEEKGADEHHMCVVIRDSGDIIGYMVLRSRAAEGEPYDSYPVEHYTLVLVESVYYPRIDAIPQTVSETYVFQQMKKAISGEIH